MRRLPEKVQAEFNKLAVTYCVQYRHAEAFLDVLENAFYYMDFPTQEASSREQASQAESSLSDVERQHVKKNGRPSKAREEFIKAGVNLLKACSNVEVLPRKYLCKMAGFSTPSFYRYFKNMEDFWQEVRSCQKQNN